MCNCFIIKSEKLQDFIHSFAPLKTNAHAIMFYQRLQLFTTKFSPILINLNWSCDAIVFIRGETLSVHSVRPRKIPGWIINRKRNYGFTRSTQPIMVHERTAICKSQLEAIIKNPVNTRGAGTSFWSLVRRRTIPAFSFVCNAGY